jgi:hypothetical protein
MLSTLAASIVAALSALMPILTSAGATQIEPIVSLLVNLIPALVGELTSLIPEVKNIIAALQGNGSVTAAQMTTLATLDAQCDAAFEAAATAAGQPASSASATAAGS